MLSYLGPREWTDTMKRPRRLLTVAEVATILRLHPNTVYRLMKRGEIPGFKIGESWRISRYAVDAWISGAHAGKAPSRR